MNVFHRFPLPEYYTTICSFANPDRREIKNTSRLDTRAADRDMPAGKRWCMVIPPSFRDRIIGHALLRYRKDQRYGPPVLDALGRLHIPLPENQEFVYLELAVGDLNITSLGKNKDGSFGDELIVESIGDVSFLMGFRLTLRK